jgi:hypothetical protein
MRNPLQSTHAPPLFLKGILNCMKFSMVFFNIQVPNDDSLVLSAPEGIQSSSNLTPSSIEGYIARKRVGERLQQAEKG